MRMRAVGQLTVPGLPLGPPWLTGSRAHGAHTGEAAGACQRLTHFAVCGCEEEAVTAPTVHGGAAARLTDAGSPSAE